jgi:hypothetical protein
MFSEAVQAVGPGLLSELGPVFVIAFPRIDGLAAPGVGSCAGCERQSDQRAGNKLP